MQEDYSDQETQNGLIHSHALFPNIYFL